MAGNLNFVEKVKSELGFKAAHREVIFRFQRCSTQNPKSKIENPKLIVDFLPLSEQVVRNHSSNSLRATPD